MASTSRASRALADLSALRTSSFFVCRSCRQQALRRRITFLQQSRCASDKPLPFTEKIRRKIWGTDNPPGLADPYGGPSFLEKRRMRREAEDGEEYPRKELESYEHQLEQDIELEPEPEFESEAREDLRTSDVYVPATTWDGLEHLGHKGHWTDLPPKGADAYQSFHGQPVLRLQNREEVIQCLTRASAEVLNLERDGSEDLNCLYADLSKNQKNTTESFRHPSPTGAIEHQDLATFHIVKRFQQLSGYRIPDPVISKSKTWELLIDTVAKDVGPKPKNLAETLMMKETLTSLPNLKIMDRRETPVDKEKEVGRWKVIEAELEERGLPVLGQLRPLS